MKKNILKMMLLVFCLISFFWLCRAFFLGSYPDFTTQYFSTKHIFTNTNPYQGGKELFTQQVYPPTTSFFYVPFTFSPIEVSQIVFLSLSIVSLLLTFYFLSKTFSISFFSYTNIVCMTFAFIAFPTKFSLGMGQINIFVLLGLSLGLYFYQQKKEFISGLFFGLALVVKLFPLPLIPFLLIKKKILIGVLLVCAALVSLTVLFIPISYSKYFVFEVLPTFFNSWKLDYYNQALSGFLGRELGVTTFSANLKLILTLILLGVSYFAVFRNKGNDTMSFALRFGLLITTTLIINTFSWQHHFVWLVIPFYIVIVFLQKQNQGRLPYVLLFIAYILVSLNFSNPQLMPKFLQSHVLFGAILLWFLNLHFLLINNKK